MAACYNNLANLYCDTHRFADGEQMYNSALEIYKRLADTEPHAYDYDLAGSYDNLGVLYHKSTYKKCLREEWGKFTGYQLLSSFWLKVARTDEDGNTTR